MVEGAQGRREGRRRYRRASVGSNASLLVGTVRGHSPRERPPISQHHARVWHGATRAIWELLRRFYRSVCLLAINHRSAQATISHDNGSPYAIARAVLRPSTSGRTFGGSPTPGRIERMLSRVRVSPLAIARTAKSERRNALLPRSLPTTS